MQKPFFHHYYLTQLLDQQKYKSTYLAYPQGDMKLKVVVKIFDEACMLPDQDYAKSLTAMKAFLALDHPHIVPVLNIDIENRQPYIVTRYMAHGSLRQRLDDWSPKLMHWTSAVNMVIRIAEALIYAHERQMIHANIKPSNIFFDFVGGVLLADFRPSDFIDISKLNYKTDLQTISYMAPEQFMGKSSPSSDQYALACLAYELLTGHAPFSEAQNFSLMWQKHASEQPLSPTTVVPELPPAIALAILRAMSKAPEMRYPDIATFAQALASELPASAIHKGKTTRPFGFELDFPRPSSPPRKDTHTIKLSALTGSLPIFEDTRAVKKKSALNGAVPNPVTPDTVSEEKPASDMSAAPVAKKIPHPGRKETIQQDTVSEEKLAADMAPALVAKKNSHPNPGIKDTKPLAPEVLSSLGLLPKKADVTQRFQQKQLVMLGALLAQWKNHRFRHPKRFVLWICILVLLVIFSFGYLLSNGLNTDIHQTALSNKSTPQGTHTRQAVGGVFATTTPTATTSASTRSATAVSTSIVAKTPGVSGGTGGGGNGGGSGTGGGGGNGGGGNSGGGNTSVTPTPIPVVAHNLAQSAGVSTSSSFDAGGWGLAYVNDGRISSTSGSMGWSSDGDFLVNHTEWITFAFSSEVPVSRVDLYPRNDSGNVGEGFPIDFSVQLSFDDSTWRSVVSQSNYPLPGTGGVQSFSFKTQNTTYIMIQATTLRQNPGEYNRYRMQFAEIAIY